MQGWKKSNDAERDSNAQDRCVDQPESFIRRADFAGRHEVVDEPCAEGNNAYDYGTQGDTVDVIPQQDAGPGRIV